jgi:DNA-binding Lrp family transcriptional regulator
LSGGTSSYEELARVCKVSRNTVYRRIAAMEQEGVIRNTIGCNISLEKLDLNPVIVGVNVAQVDQNRVAILLATNKRIRMLWRTYGNHNITLLALCPKGSEGEFIHEIKTVLEEFGAQNLNISVGFIWEKMDLSPFEDEESPIEI